MSDTTEKVRYGGRRGGDILGIYSRDFKPEPSPVEIFRQHVSQWFYAAKMLRVFEAVVLCNKPSQEDIEMHQLACSTLITFGAFASKYAKDQGEGLENVGLTVADIEAETRLLRDNFKMFHDDTMKVEEAEKVLREAFV